MGTRYLMSVVPLLMAAAVMAEEERYFPEQMTAQKLLHACASSSMTATGRERQRYCYGFVSGVEETERLLRGELSAAPPVVCLPHGKSASFYAGVFRKYAARQGTDLERPAVRVVMEALEWEFRCN